MWNNAFSDDDPSNPKLADEYGIVMGTPHHEPLARAQAGMGNAMAKAIGITSTNGEVLRRFGLKECAAIVPTRTSLR